MAFTHKIIGKILGDKKSKNVWMRKYDCPSCGAHEARKSTYKVSGTKEKSLLMCAECGYEEDTDII
jgi:transcription elongation factor Elf1